MRTLEIKDVSEATECDRCFEKFSDGCKIGSNYLTEIIACRIKHTRNRILSDPDTIGYRIKYIADYYGVNNQNKIAIEEMSELTKAICKLGRYPAIDHRNEKYINDVIEEIADVWIMIEQLKYLYGSDAVNKIICDKINKVIDGIEKEKRDK